MIDAAEFFVDDITEPATIDGHETRVFFDKTRFVMDNGFNDVISYSPVVTCLTSFVEQYAIKNGSTVALRNKTYKVKEVDDDGHGVTTLHLYESR